jgi:hypothetical protein
MSGTEDFSFFDTFSFELSLGLMIFLEGSVMVFGSVFG